MRTSAVAVFLMTWNSLPDDVEFTQKISLTLWEKVAHRPCTHVFTAGPKLALKGNQYGSGRRKGR
jgi:hypothetical protein